MALLTLLCAVGSLAPTTAAPIEPNDLLAKMRSAYQKTEEVYLEIQSKHPTVQGEYVGQPIKVSYKKPGFLRIDLELPSGKKFRSVTDGKTVVISDFSREPFKAEAKAQNRFGGFPVNLEVMSFTDFAKELSSDKGGNMETSKLTVTDKGERYLLHEEAPAQQVVVDYEVDKKTFFIMKTTVTREGDKEPFAVHTVAKIDLKPKFEMDHFSFPTK